MNGLYLLVDYIIKFLSSFISLGLIANAIGPVEFSKLISITNLAIWIALIFSFGLDRALLASRMKKEKVLQLALFLSASKIIFLLLIVLLGSQFSTKLLLSAFLAICLSFECLDYYFRRQGNFKIGAKARVTASVTSLIIRLFIIYTQVVSLEIILISYVVEYLLTFVILIRGICKDNLFKTLSFEIPSNQDVKSCFKIGVPVMLSGSSMFFINYWPSLVGSFLFNYREIGLFIMAQKICDATNIIQNAYHQSMAPKIIKLHEKIENNDLEFLRKIIRNGFILGLITVLGVYSLAFVYIDYILGSEYIQIFEILPFLLAGQLLSIWSGSRSNVLLALNNTKIDLYIILISTVITVFFFYLMQKVLFTSSSPMMLMCMTVVFGKFCVGFIVPYFFPYGKLVAKAQVQCFLAKS